MVQLKGPGLSQAASGQFAKVLAFAHSKKGTYAKARSSPRQPRTGAQVSVRAMVKYLSQAWKLLTSAEQESWHDLARADQLAPYHAYIRENMKRWRTFRSPTKEYPAAEILTPQTGSNIQVIPEVASVRIGLRINMLELDVASIVFRGHVTGFTIDLAHVIKVVPRNFAITWTWTRDTPLDAGTYWYNSYTITADGNSGAAGAYRRAIVT